MYLLQVIDRFQFQDDPVFHHYIDEIFTNHFSFIGHLDWHLILRFQLSFSKFNQKRIFVNFLQKAWPKDFVYLEYGTVDLLCELIDFHK